MPESPRKSNVWFESRGISRWTPVANTIPQAKTRTTTVRMAVARFELTSLTPTLARMAVAAAAMAESTAKASQPMQ